MRHHPRQKNRLKQKIPKIKTKYRHQITLKKNRQLIKKNHIDQNMIHQNHHQNEIIQHEAVQNQDLGVIDRVTGLLFQ
jgi:hypothetical protein